MLAEKREAVSAVAVPTPLRLSLRDPAGEVHRAGRSIFRLVDTQYLPTLEKIYQSRVLRELQDEGKFIGARRLPPSEWNSILGLLDGSRLMARERIGAVLEHPTIAFPSFSHEWAPEMLYHTAQLTLEIVQRLARERLTLKDATPRNLLFQNFQGVFIDFLSVEPQLSGSSTWTPFAQFLRNFVLPLLANRHFNLGLDGVFLSHRDGLEPEEVYALCSLVQKFSPSFFYSATLPTLLSRKKKDGGGGTNLYKPALLSDPKKAEFILRAMINQLSRVLVKAQPAPRKSVWSGYVSSDFSFTREEYARKLDYIRAFVQERRPSRVLDIGCNVGDFSFAAAAGGAEVVGLDADPVVVGQTWKRAFEQKAKVLPLAINFARPTPGLGWNNSELPSFLDRARGEFDTVFMLAVLHHLMITEGIPLRELLATVSTVTTGWVVLEYIGPEDKAFQKLCRGRDLSHCTQPWFEETAGAFFEIVEKTRLEHSHRWLYLLRKK